MTNKSDMGQDATWLYRRILTRFEDVMRDTVVL